MSNFKMVTKAFKVWLRPTGSTCKIRVEGSEQAEWLRNKLGEQGIECAKPRQASGTDFCNLHATYKSEMSHEQFQKLIATMPEVELMFDAA